MDNGQLNENIQNGQDMSAMPTMNAFVDYTQVGNQIPTTAQQADVAMQQSISNPVDNQQILVEQNVQQTSDSANIMPSSQQPIQNETIDNQVVQPIPTIEQPNQSFVAETQAISSEKPTVENKKINYVLIIVLLLVVFLVMFFVFPILKNYF